MRNHTLPPDVRKPLTITPASAALAPNAGATLRPCRSHFDELTAIHLFMHHPTEPRQLKRLQHRLQQMGVLI
jgi:hypothetical protein